MNYKDLRNLDPQRVVTVRFASNGEWKDEWVDIRLLYTDGERDTWFLTPLSLDGRPFSLMFEGHSSENGRFVTQDESHIMEIREMVENRILREGYENSNLSEYLEEQSMSRKDLSSLGKVFYDAVTEFKNEVPDALLERMLDEL